ncbi:hypothetical protein ACJA88_009492 [Fusarium oxysporum]
MPSMSHAEKTQYDSFAPKYASVEELPCSKLEGQLVRNALGDCTGLEVLDLGGGSGLHARRAIDAGASVVDVVDISPEMMKAGEEIEQSLGRKDRIRWFEADVTKPVAEQVKLEERYDIVMANWVFDHATSVSELRSMYENVVKSLKSGGKFIGVRSKSIRANYMSYGKYGVTFTDATSMESTFSLSDDIGKELGLVEIHVAPAEETELVKNDREFWEDYLKDPNFVVVVAKKA